MGLKRLFRLITMNIKKNKRDGFDALIKSNTEPEAEDLQALFSILADAVGMIAHTATGKKAWEDVELEEGDKETSDLEKQAYASVDTKTKFIKRMKQAIATLDSGMKKYFKDPEIDFERKSIYGDGYGLLWTVRKYPNKPENYSNQQTSTGHVQVIFINKPAEKKEDVEDMKISGLINNVRSIRDELLG